MSKKFLLYLGVAIISAFMIASCLPGIEGEQEQPTREGEIEMLQTYLDTLVARGNDIDTTEMGVYYVRMEEGEGDFATEGDTLVVKYSGYFMDGFLFDSSEIRFPEGMDFVLGEDPFIPGWEDGMKVMNKGSRVQFIIPSEFAYGSQGYDIIPPYETLIFFIEMLDLRPLQE